MSKKKKNSRKAVTEKIALAAVIIKLIHEIFDFIKCLVE